MNRLLFCVTFSVCVLIFLSGCGPTSQERDQQQFADQQKQQIVAQNAMASAELQGCRARYPQDQRNRENAIPSAACFLAAARKFNPQDDLLMALAYKRMQLSELLASGKISSAEYFSQFQDYASRIQTIRMERENQARAVRAAESAAAANARLARCLAARQRSAEREASYSRNAPTTGLGMAAAVVAGISDGRNESRECD